MTEATKRSPAVQFRDADLEPWLDTIAEPHESRGLAAVRMLTWFRAIIDDEIKRSRIMPDELNLIADALSGTFVDTTTLRLLWAEVDESLKDGLAEKWDVDGPVLVGRLREMDMAALAAVVIAARSQRE